MIPTTKYESWNDTSKAALANTNPVKPPKVNKNKKPIAKSIGVLGVIDPVHKVATQLNILIPVGNAITDVTEVN